MSLRKPGGGAVFPVAMVVIFMHNACMVALQIRDVPEEVRDTLAAQARAHGQSLQAYLLDLIETQARRERNVAVLDRFAGRSDGSRVLPDETPAELAQERDRSNSTRHAK